jgi:PiT family inorganic phosphate transporter
MLFVLIILALVYAFLNGYRDSSSILAGVIASRAMHPRWALYLVAAADLIAPFIFGSAVARSITTGLVDTSAVTLDTLVIAMVAALGWSLFSWWRGIPSSSTHSLIGGLLGAVLITRGPQVILTGGLVYVILPLFLAPILGLILGYLIMGLLLYSLRKAAPRVNSSLRRLQIITMLLLAMSESSNDAQKSMGMIALGLVLAGKLSSFSIPVWVLALCAFSLALGASRGDWRQIRNLGGKIYRIRPLNALASQVASSSLILTASALGMPVSSPHVISTALLGAGAAERINKVRWQVASRMATTWAVTIPATMVTAALLFKAMTALQGLGGNLQGFLLH